MAQKQIKKGKSEELDYKSLLVEDLKAGDIVGIAVDDGDDKKSVINWDFYFVISTSGDNIIMSKTPTGNTQISLDEIADDNEKAFYLYIPFEEGRETWTPGNRNLHEIPIETVITEVFQLSHKECGWKTRSVDSIAEETGLQNGRIRRALRGSPTLFKETEKGNWTYTRLGESKPDKTVPTPTKPVREGRRHGPRL